MIESTTNISKDRSVVCTWSDELWVLKSALNDPVGRAAEVSGRGALVNPLFVGGRCGIYEIDARSFSNDHFPVWNNESPNFNDGNSRGTCEIASPHLTVNTIVERTLRRVDEDGAASRALGSGVCRASF